MGLFLLEVDIQLPLLAFDRDEMSGFFFYINGIYSISIDP